MARSSLTLYAVEENIRKKGLAIPLRLDFASLVTRHFYGDLLKTLIPTVSPAYLGFWRGSDKLEWETIKYCCFNYSPLLHVLAFTQRQY